ncbi:MAG: nitrate/sulfonate/bicarbonate transporter ATP-binding protein [Bacillota bacterium]|jgi:NitT/TauT family transport system ATP-binding protein|nr:nitrate/sulfonate/bicarbonate transporter ATP-binding protein [Bacillota bacterium]
MLSIENVSISYKAKKEKYIVIDDLSLRINKGEALIILGPSGCGKSTLINALAGTIHVDSGIINFIVNDKNESLNPKKHKIGIIPQNFGLLPWKTVRENCMLPIKIRNKNVDIKENSIEIIDKIYNSLGIINLLDRFPKELSGGQAQRVAIARAFIQKPDLLLMDEPFSALDEITREEARELFLKIWKLNQTSTILVTHSIEEALYLGNRIIVMGKHMGEFKYEMENSYFGKMHPDDSNYYHIKKILREKLM